MNNVKMFTLMEFSETHKSVPALLNKISNICRAADVDNLITLLNVLLILLAHA